MARIRLFLLGLLCLVGLGRMAAAQVSAVPNSMSFQGRLSQPNGTPVPDGNNTIQFSVYNALTGGTLLWQRSLASVPVKNGQFAVLLDFSGGFQNGATQISLFGGSAAYLEIAVNGGAPQTPRQKLVTVAYAFKANSVLDGSISNASLASGSITADKFALNLFNPLAWLLGGNSGTDGTQFLGTTDNQPLNLKVNGWRAVRYRYAEDTANHFRSINIFGGSEINNITTGVVGATISGGGQDNFTGTDYSNYITANFGTIGGGYGNAVTGEGATVAGGFTNTGGGGYVTVGGGYGNNASDDFATVTGGFGNIASGIYTSIGGGANNLASRYAATIAGGFGNTASGTYTSIGGGTNNLASDNYATVGGGISNTANKPDATIAGGFGNTASGTYTSIGGGNTNTASSNYATVAGGTNNAARGLDSVIAGGSTNTASGPDSAIGGGNGNTAGSSEATVAGGISNMASNSNASVGGGYHNTASGTDATVAGGSNNLASGLDATVAGGGLNTASGSFSMAAGGRAKALHNGAFVWKSTDGNDFASTADGQFLISAYGGVGINTNNPGSYTLNVNGNTRVVGFFNASDARWKKNIAPLEDALDTVLALRGVSYQWDKAKFPDQNFGDGRQIGFIAQEVEKVLPELVSTDSDGYKSVAYANVVPILVESVKTLKAQLDDKQQQIDALRAQGAEIAALKAQLAELTATIKRGYKLR